MVLVSIKAESVGVSGYFEALLSTSVGCVKQQRESRMYICCVFVCICFVL